jgi:hypothetical protein
MQTLPNKYSTILNGFSHLFSKRIWERVQVLLAGAILSPAERTVTAALRAVGMSQEKHFQNYHRVLNRAIWSSLDASRILLMLLVNTFALFGPIVFGLDDTIERRRGEKIKAKGIYRDPVRSSHSHMVKASGLRWLSLMLLAPIPWAGRVWALPFLTVLAPSERYYETKVCKHKKLTDWARQMLFQLRKWLPERTLVVVADSSYAVIELLWRMTQLKNPICMIARFRLDAALYEPVVPTPGKMGRPRKKGKRLPTLETVLDDEQTVWQSLVVREWYGEKQREIEIVSSTAVWYHSGKPPVPIRWVLIRDPKKKFKSQALLCTNLETSPEQIIKWFVRRWQVEVTFHEVRTHLGVETQRQWADLAILRITPALLGLFSLVTLLANCHAQKNQLLIQRTAWYDKKLPTFSDALLTVKQEFWHQIFFHTSSKNNHIQNLSFLPPQPYTSALFQPTIHPVMDKV